MSGYNPWERGESESAVMWASAGPSQPATGARPRTVREVQKQMALVRMFERFIRHMLPREVETEYSCVDEPWPCEECE